MVDLDSDPTEDPGGGGDRQAASDHEREPDHLLHCQRHCQVFCNHPGHVHGGSPSAGRAEHHGAGDTEQRHPFCIDLQRHHHPLPDPACHEGRQYRPMSSGKLLGRNMLIYGLGGVIAPFVGIKLIDLLIAPILVLLGI